MERYVRVAKVLRSRGSILLRKLRQSTPEMSVRTRNGKSERLLTKCMFPARTTTYVFLIFRISRVDLSCVCAQSRHIFRPKFPRACDPGDHRKHIETIRPDRLVSRAHLRDVGRCAYVRVCVCGQIPPATSRLFVALCWNLGTAGSRLLPMRNQFQFRTGSPPAMQVAKRPPRSRPEITWASPSEEASQLFRTRAPACATFIQSVCGCALRI